MKLDREDLGRHRRVGNIVSYCDACEQSWPCETAFLLAALEVCEKALKEWEGEPIIDHALAILSGESDFEEGGA